MCLGCVVVCVVLALFILCSCCLFRALFFALLDCNWFDVFASCCWFVLFVLWCLVCVCCCVWVVWFSCIG